MIKDQKDKNRLLAELSSLILRLVKMYQIPNFDEESAVLLSEWVIDEYQHYDLGLVTETLRKPPILNDQAWRLTPDTLKAWIDLKRTERETERLRKESRKRQETEPEKPSAEDLKNIDVIIEDFKRNLLSCSKANTSGWQLVADQIRKEDKLRQEGKSIVKSESRGYNYTTEEYLAEKELRRKWMVECFDLHTGKPNEKWMSFEEYKMI